MQLLARHPPTSIPTSNSRFLKEVSEEQRLPKATFLMSQYAEQERRVVAAVATCSWQLPRMHAVAPSRIRLFGSISA